MTIEENVGTHIDGEVLPAQQAEPTTTTETARDFESEARDMGWVPESEFRGAKDKWKPAEQFVKDGENFLPILKANERKLREELKAKEADVAKRVARMERVIRSNFERDAQNYEREIARLKGEQVKAVEAGDVAEFKKLDAAISKVPIPVEEPDVGTGMVTPANLEEQFATDNPWYGTDEDLTVYAQGYSQRIAQKHLDDHGAELPMADNLKQVLAKVKATFPAKFTKPNGHAAVDGGGSFTSPSARSSDPLAKLPVEARAQAKIDMEKYPTVFKTAADWVKKYEEK